MTLVVLRGIERSFALAGGTRLPVLRGIDLDLAPGSWTALMGPSGSGKSTLMNVIGLLDRPNAGTVAIAGARADQLDDDAASQLRSRTIGFVFQGFHLIPQLTLRENVELPLMYQGVPAAERRRRALDRLEQVGLATRERAHPPELSGGMQQRAAIARALVAAPPLLIADEPTGNLDSRTGAEVLDLLAGLNAQGMTLLMVTHDAQVAARAQRVVRMKDGLIAADAA